MGGVKDGLKGDWLPLADSCEGKTLSARQIEALIKRLKRQEGAELEIIKWQTVLRLMASCGLK